MIALAAALKVHGAAVELELLAGVLGPVEGLRAAAAGLRIAAKGRSRDDADVFVVDLPDPAAMAPRCPPHRLVVFDDRDRFTDRAAVLVQPSQPRWSGAGRVDAVLAGYAYVPIDARYRDRHGSMSLAAEPTAARGRPPRVVACFGGSDPAEVTGRLAAGLAAALPGLEVIVGSSYRGSTAGWPIMPLRDPADLPDRLAATELAIVSAGTIKFEVACLGRPAILLAVADDQLAVGPSFAATGAAVFLGDGRTIDPALVSASALELLADDGRRATMRRISAELIDGLGADRVAAAVLSLAGT